MFIDFYTFYAATLLNSLIISWSLFWFFFGQGFLGSYNSWKKWVYFFFSDLSAFYFFFLHYYMAKTFRPMLDRSGSKSRDPYRVPDFRGKAFSLFSLSMMLSVWFLIKMPFISWRKFLSILIFWEFLSWTYMEFCQILFLHLLIWSYVFSFNLLMRWITLIDFKS